MDKRAINLLYFSCLPDVLLLLVFCGSSSRLQGVIVVFCDHTHFSKNVFKMVTMVEILNVMSSPFE